MTDLPAIEAQLLQGLGIVLLALAIAGGKLALQWLNAQLGTARIQLSASTKAELEDAAGKALAFGFTQADGIIRAQGWDHIDTKNAVLATATSYVIGQFPDVLKRAGIDPNNPVAASLSLAGILTRKLPEIATSTAASPATPPVMPPATTLVTPPPGGSVMVSVMGAGGGGGPNAGMSGLVAPTT